MKLTSIRKGNKLIEVNKQGEKYVVVSFLLNDDILKETMRYTTPDVDKAFETFRLMVDSNGPTETKTETV